MKYQQQPLGSASVFGSSFTSSFGLARWSGAVMKTSTNHEPAAQLNLDIEFRLFLTDIEQHRVCGLATGDIEDHRFNQAPVLEPFLDEVQCASSGKWLTISWIDHLFWSPVVGHLVEFRQSEPSLGQQPDELVSDIFVPFSHNTTLAGTGWCLYHMIADGARSSRKVPKPII
jgi:hypothetical protein